jgi:ribosome recycling factor
VIDDVVADSMEKMEKAVAHVQGEFGSVRTGRATPALVEKLKVDYYGTDVPLQQIAGFSVPEARLLVIQPYDKGAIKAIEKAIQHSDLGINPSNDGQVIRLAFPPLTEERRKDMVKLVKHKAEEGRVAVRNVRRHSKADMEALHGEISDDDIHRGEDGLQKLTDRFIVRIDQLLANKEEELLEV